MKINELKQEYTKEQKNKEQKHPFLLFELAGGKENAHTRALMAILNFKDHMFLPSFLQDIFGLSCNITDKIKISDQESAIGEKDNSKGFIDLLIEFEDKDKQKHKLVIENKVFGAKDLPNQLNRYIATIKKDKISDVQKFNEWLDLLKACTNDDLKEDLTNCHIAYLTLDGGEPLDTSLNPKLKKNIDYYEINYVDSIIPWIRNTVLNECPYHDQGVTIAGLIQYLASLENLSDNSGKLSVAVQNYVAGINKPTSEKYNTILEAMENIRPKNKDTNEDVYEYSYMLWAELKRAAEEIYSQDVYKPWILHFTPSFMCLYKPEWMNIGKGKYSIPFVHFYFPNVISKNQNNFAWEQWKLAFEHLNPNDVNLQQEPYKAHLGNKNRTIGIKLSSLQKIDPIQRPDDLEDKEKRRSYFAKVIESINGIAEIVDRSLAEIRDQELEDDNAIAFEILKNAFAKIIDKYPLV